MKISADFTVIPDAFAKAAPPENCIDGTPIVSFPFYIDALDSGMRFPVESLVPREPARGCADVRFQRFSRARDSG